MPQSPHDRVAELHNLAAHAHAAAATAHGKGDHLTAHELSEQAHEHSIERVQTRQSAPHGCYPVQKSVERRDLLIRYFPKENAGHERLCTQLRKLQPEVSNHRN